MPQECSLHLFELLRRALSSPPRAPPRPFARDHPTKRRGRRSTYYVATMFKHNAKTKVEFFDDAGEIQIVPIDTVVGDGGHDLEVDDSRRNQAQGFGASGSKSKDASKTGGPRWKEPDIVA